MSAFDIFAISRAMASKGDFGADLLQRTFTNEYADHTLKDFCNATGSCSYDIILIDATAVLLKIKLVMRQIPKQDKYIKVYLARCYII